MTTTDEALRHGFDPYADTGSFFGDIGHAVSSVGKAAVSVAKAAAPVINKALPIAQTILKNTGPFGMVASGAIGAMRAGIAGKSILNIGLAAAEGAAPSGIDRAIAAAHRVANGEPLVKLALSEAVSQLAPGSGERFGFNVAASLLAKKATKAVMGAHRRAMATEGQRRAFDAAVGTVSRVVSGKHKPTPAHPVGHRPGDLKNVLPAAAKRKPISVIHPNVALAVSAIKKNPHLGGLTPADLAKRLGTTPQLAQRAMRLAPRRLRWRSLSAGATAFIRRHVKHAPMAALRRSDTKGLEPDGATYTVETGDFPGKIATKLTGNGNRWPELIAANPQKKTVSSNIGKVFATLFKGEKLIVPTSWRKPVAPEPVVSLPPDIVSSSPGLPQISTAPTKTNPLPVSLPSPAPSASSSSPSVSTASTTEAVEQTAATIQAKSILVAWSKTDGAAEPGIPDYGARAEDMSTTFGTRDKFVASSFEGWSNRTQKTTLSKDGELSDALLSALRSWAEKRSSLPVPALPGLPGVVKAPTGTTATGSKAPAEVPSNIPGVPPVLTGTTVALPGSSAEAPQSSSPSVKKSGDGGGSLIPVAAGAGLGFLAFGPLGAVGGAAAGMLLS